MQRWMNIPIFVLPQEVSGHPFWLISLVGDIDFDLFVHLGVGRCEQWNEDEQKDKTIFARPGS